MIFVRGLVVGLFLLGLGGCGSPKVESKIDREAYLQVKREFQKIYPEHENWPSRMYTIHPYLNAVERFIIETRRGARRNILSRAIYLNIMYTTARRSCHRAGVSFGQFNRAHARFGREGLTFHREVKKVMALACRIRDTYREGSEVETCLFEAYLRLTMDLGTIRFEEYRMIIKADKRGNIRIWDDLNREVFSLAEIGEEILSPNPYYLVHITPHPLTPAEELFKIMAEIPFAQRTVVCDSFYNYKKTHVQIYPCIDLDTLAHDPGLLRDTSFLMPLAFIQVKKDGGILLNSEQITDLESLGQTIKKLMERSINKAVFISADKEVACSQIMGIIKLARDNEATEIALIPRGLIAGHEPQLDTRAILEAELTGFNEIKVYEGMSR